MVTLADSEGDNFVDDITRIWTIQIALDPDDDVQVFADQPGYTGLDHALDILHNSEKVAFHNAMGYDFFAINKIFPDTLKPGQMIDTLIMSRLMDSTANRHSLAEYGEYLKFPKGHHDDFSQFSEDMATYGAQDVRILQAMWKGVNPSGSVRIRPFGQFYEDYTQACDDEFWTAYVIEKQRQHGFRFDIEKAWELEGVLRGEVLEIERNMQKVFPPIVTKRYSEKQVDKITGKPKRLKDEVEVFNPGSREQVANRLIDKYGWKPTKKTPTGRPKVDETILGELPYEEAQFFATYLTSSKKLGMLADGENAWLRLAQEHDNGWYLHGYVNTLGTRTHRMSHSKPNMGQVDSDPRMRELFVSDPGHVLVGVDAEGLELRELAHFLAPYDGGAYGRFVHEGRKEDETDVHSMNRKAAGLYLRKSAKRTIYAHNYGCSDPKLGEIVKEDAKEAGQEVPTGSNRAIGKKLRAKLESGIVGLGDLISKCKRQHGRHGFMRGHDGRAIPSASAHSSLNTLLQGNGSIVMKKALVVFDQEMEKLQLMDKFGYCANVHDEFQLSVHPDYVEKVVEVGKWSITRAGELLEVRCPLVGSADIGNSWAETH